MECNKSILNMAPNFETDNNEFTQRAFDGSQWFTVEPHEIKARILEAAQSRIIDVNVILALINRHLLLISKYIYSLSSTDTCEVNL